MSKIKVFKEEQEKLIKQVEGVIYSIQVSNYTDKRKQALNKFKEGKELLENDFERDS